jgi:C-terminal processing protease CtpA/Prc
LIDQNSYSDAEIFPAGFRALKLGKIVGVPTPGYVIGTYGGRLVDGTQIRLPSWGWYTADGKNMENLGIPPDITVENTPEDIAAGRDRQLETAVQTLLREVGPKPDTTAGAEEVGVRASANANPNGGSSSVTPGKVKPGSEKPLH